MSSEQKSDNAALPIWGLQILPRVLRARGSHSDARDLPHIGASHRNLWSLEFP